MWPRSATRAAGSGKEHELKSPLPGTVVRLVAEEGQELEAGDTVLVLEAMKMESEIKADKGGVLRSITVGKGQVVAAGDVLALIEEK